MRAIFCVFATLLIIASSFAQAPDRQTSSVIKVRNFIHNQPILSGDGWTIAKQQSEDGCWKARLENGEIVHEFADCGERDDWMRFYLWEGRGEGDERVPDLLFVLRYAGGAHGREHLDIVDVGDGLRILFSTDDQFNFGRIEDLDHDGWPEVVGYSRRFDPILELSTTQSPHPTLIFAHDPTTDTYLCQNHRFSEELESSAERFRKAFNLNRPVGDKVPYKPSDPKVHRSQFAPLVRWIVEVCYMGREEEAWGILNEHSTSEAVSIAKASISETLAADRYYQEMNRLMAP